MARSHARLRLRRTGGFAGIATEAAVDTAELEPGEAEPLLAALDAVDLHSLAGRRPPPPGPPDTFRYVLDVERDATTHSITLAEADVPQALRPVLAALSARAHPVRKV
jgi:hypothetical protein